MKPCLENPDELGFGITALGFCSVLQCGPDEVLQTSRFIESSASSLVSYFDAKLQLIHPF